MSNNNNIKRFASLEVLRMAKGLLKADKTSIEDVLNAARMLALGSKYEYVITEGDVPDGEGWEHSPHSKNPNSYRRKVGPHLNAPKQEESKPSQRQYKMFDASKLPETMKNTMRKALNFDVDYFEHLRDGARMQKDIRNIVGSDYARTETSLTMTEFAETGYGRKADARTELSNFACNIMGVKPDGYCLDKKYELSDEEREDAETFIKASQLIASMTGLVDKDGYVTAYRGTRGQFKDGKYHGSNCESWTVNPDKVFREGQIVKAKIPVERILGCFAGSLDIYPCKEDEITCCTSDIDLECEELTGDDDRTTAEEYDMGVESFEAQERIANNIRDMLGEQI